MANRYTRKQVHEIAGLLQFIHYQITDKGYSYFGEAMTKIAKAGIKAHELPMQMEEEVGHLLKFAHDGLERKKQREAQKEAAIEAARKQIEALRVERSAKEDARLRAMIRQGNPSLTDAEVESVLPEFKKQMALERAMDVARGRTDVNLFTAD